MPLSLSNLVAALDQFPRYHAIDVFADDLGELRELSSGFRPLDAQGQSFLVSHQGREFKLEIFPDRGVVRLSRTSTASSAIDPSGGFMARGLGEGTAGGVTGAAGGLVGEAVAIAAKQKGTGLLGGLLLGLLVGASLGGAAGDARRVFALSYDRAGEQWQAYDGGLLRWMKSQLAV